MTAAPDMLRLMEVVLSKTHRDGSRTRHQSGASPVPRPAKLQIVRFDCEVYLLHLDAEGNELTDTCHDSIEAAVRQADFEFDVRADDWVALAGAKGDADHA